MMDVYEIFGRESNTPSINAMNMATGLKEAGLHKIFFKPNDRMIDWLIEYANGRLIFDVGSGSGHLLRMIHSKGYKKLMGIEPVFDYDMYIRTCMMKGVETIHMYPGTSKDAGAIIKGAGDKAMIVLARPCHSNFVEQTLDLMHEDQEALYITIPENWEMYNDLGKYRKRAKKLIHKGSSKDLEIIWSIKKK